MSMHSFGGEGGNPEALTYASAWLDFYKYEYEQRTIPLCKYLLVTTYGCYIMLELSHRETDYVGSYNSRLNPSLCLVKSEKPHVSVRRPVMAGL